MESSLVALTLSLTLLAFTPSAFPQIYDKYSAYQLRPGRRCEANLWQDLVRPVSDALTELYLSQGTSDANDARARYHIASREEFDSKLNQVMRLDMSAVEAPHKAILNIERTRVLTFDLCKGMESPYLYCNEEGQGERSGNGDADDGRLGRCRCKSEFPFEYSTVAQINCVGRSGSICAIGDDFRLDCANQRCTRGPDNTTYYCGGFPAFDARRRTLFPERDFSAGTRVTAATSRSSWIAIFTTILSLLGAVAVIND